MPWITSKSKKRNAAKKPAKISVEPVVKAKEEASQTFGNEKDAGKLQTLPTGSFLTVPRNPIFKGYGDIVGNWYKEIHA